MTPDVPDRKTDKSPDNGSSKGQDKQTGKRQDKPSGKGQDKRSSKGKDKGSKKSPDKRPDKSPDETPQPREPSEPVVPRLQQLYQETIAPAAMKEFRLRNVHELPRLSKVVVNCGIGRFLENQKLKPEIRDTVQATLATVSGQRPIIVKARKSVSNFKVREGAPSAMMVTMRRLRMWSFLDRLINLAIPRIRDFRGLKDTSFDKAGNYSMGLAEQAVWPEINMANVTFTHGMHVNIVLENSNPVMSKFVLTELGMPFVRKE